jgi:hypothetical protein
MKILHLMLKIITVNVVYFFYKIFNIFHIMLLEYSTRTRCRCAQMSMAQTDRKMLV